MDYDVFISYSSVDREVAEKIRQGLEQHGLKVFRDAQSIREGANIVLSINDALASTRTVVLLVSPDSLRSNWVRHEWASALWLELEKDSSLRLILALLSRDVLLPPLLRPKRFVDFRPPAELARSLDELVQAIQKEEPVPPPPPNAQQPLAFLAFFAEGLLPSLYTALVEQGGLGDTARTAEEAGAVRRIIADGWEMVGLDPAYLRSTWDAIPDKAMASRELLARIDQCLSEEDPFTGIDGPDARVGRGRGIFLRDVLDLVARAERDKAADSEDEALEDESLERRLRFQDLAWRLLPVLVEEDELRVALEIGNLLINSPFTHRPQDFLAYARVLLAVHQPLQALETIEPFLDDESLSRREQIAALQDWAKAAKDAGQGQARTADILAAYGKAISLARGAARVEGWDPRVDLATLLLNRATQLAVFGDDDDWSRAQSDLEVAREIQSEIGDLRGRVGTETDRVALTLDRIPEGEPLPEGLLTALLKVEKDAERGPAEDLFLYLYQKARLLSRLGRTAEAADHLQVAEERAAQAGLQHYAVIARSSRLRLRKKTGEISEDTLLAGLHECVEILATYPEGSWARNVLRRDLLEIARLLQARGDTEGAWRAAVWDFALELRKLKVDGRSRSFHSLLSLMAEIDPQAERRGLLLRENQPRLRMLLGKSSFIVIHWNDLEELPA